MDGALWVEGSHGQQPTRVSPHDDVAPYITSPDQKDWTRIVAERSYNCLAAANLIPLMSLNYPHTLQCELERVATQYAAEEPELTRDVIAAMGQMTVALGNGGIASSAVHRIAPFDRGLLNEINIGAGIRNYIELTGERPVAFWPPEGGADRDTLLLLAKPVDEGGFDVKVVICAPEQIQGYTTEPRRIILDEQGHSIIAFPFGDIGRDIAFDTGRRNNADDFGARVIRPLLQEMQRTNTWWPVLFPWKDLETLGAYDDQKRDRPQTPGSDAFYAHLLRHTLPDLGIEQVSFKQIVHTLLAEPERIPVGHFNSWTAWSCTNGLVRWDGSGNCETGGAEWKRPFYLANRQLTDAVLASVMEEFGFNGPEGKARLAELMAADFHGAFVNRGGTHSNRKLSLLSAVAAALGAGGSCGTFYDSLGTSGWTNIVLARTAVTHLRDSGNAREADRIWAQYTDAMSYVPEDQLACTPEDRSDVPLAPHLLGRTATSQYLSLGA